MTLLLGGRKQIMDRVDIMVSVDTLASNSVLPYIRIAAASFDIKTGEIIDTFDDTTRVNGGDWWARTDADLLNRLLNKNDRSSDDTIVDFISWISRQGTSNSRYLWGRESRILYDYNKIRAHICADRDIYTIVDLANMKLELKPAMKLGKMHLKDTMDDVQTLVHIVHEAYKVIMGGTNE